MKAKQFITNLLKEADIEINGPRPWDIAVHDERVFNRVIRYGRSVLAKHIDGWGDANSIDVFIRKAPTAHLDKSASDKCCIGHYHRESILLQSAVKQERLKSERCIMSSFLYADTK